MQRIRFLWLLIVTLTGCGEPLVTRTPSTQSNGEALTGYAPLQFGLSQSQVRATLKRHGKPVHSSANAEMLIFTDIWLEHAVRVEQHFDHKGQALQAIAYSETARQNASTRQQCHERFDQLWQRLAQRYGFPTLPPTTGQHGGNPYGYTRFSFADSSFLHVQYSFAMGAASPECQITASYHPPWAELCLIISNRFCNSDPSTIVKPQF